VVGFTFCFKYEAKDCSVKLRMTNGRFLLWSNASICLCRNVMSTVFLLQFVVLVLSTSVGNDRNLFDGEL
jgi:hypothetical protein